MGLSICVIGLECVNEIIITHIHTCHITGTVTIEKSHTLSAAYRRSLISVAGDVKQAGRSLLGIIMLEIVLKTSKI